MTDENFQKLVKYALAVHKRRQEICVHHDAVLNGVLGEMQKRKIKSLDVKGGRYTLQRVGIPTTACRTCGAVKEPLEGLASDHKPERIKVITHVKSEAA